MKDILDKLKEMDKKELKEAINKAKTFIETDEGKALAEKIKNGDTATKSQYGEIMEQVNKNPEIAKAIFNILKG